MTDVTQKYVIVAGEAISSLEKVSATLDKHNKVIEKGTESQKLYNTESGNARKKLKELEGGFDRVVVGADKVREGFNKLKTQSTGTRTELEKFEKRLDSTNQHFKAFRDNIRLAGQNANILQGKLDTLGNSASGASRMVRSLRDAADQAATGITQLKGSVTSHTSLLRQETTVLQYNVVALRELGTAVRRLTKDMDLKNKTVDDQVAAQLRDRESVNSLMQGYTVLSSIIISMFVHRAIGEMIQGMQEGTRQAQEFQLRLGEIATVSLEMSNSGLKVAKSTQEWTDQLLVLQRTYGLGILDQSAALYEALSAQIVTAVEAQGFLADGSKLAITAVSSLADSTKILAALMNAYSLNADQASAISSTLFAAVDRGTFRLEDLGNSFARANVLAAQLGLTYQEVAGSVALLSRQGLDAESSSTLLLNVFNGLIKPTEKLNEFFKELGLNNAETALKTLGYVGVMKLLAQEVEKGNSRLSDMAGFFDDIRGLVGAAGLTKSFEQLGDDIAYVSNATEVYNKAFEEQMKNLGVRGKVELEKFKQYFLVQFGLPFQEMLVNLAEGAGGADKAINRFAQALLTVTTAGVAFFGTQRIILPFLAGLQAGYVKAGQSVWGYYRSLLSANAAQIGLSIGIPIIVTGLVEMYYASARAAQNLRLLMIELDANIFAENQKHIEKLTESIDKYQKTIKDQSPFQEYLKKFREIRELNNQFSKDFEKTYKAINKSIKSGLEISVDGLTKGIKKIEDELDNLRDSITDAEEALLKKRLEAADVGFEQQLIGKDGIDAARILINQRNQLLTLANQALANNNRKLAEEFFDRVDKLHQEAIRRLVAAQQQANQIINQGNIALNNQGGFNIRQGGVNIRGNVNPGQKPNQPPVKVQFNQAIQAPANAQLAAQISQLLVTLEQERLQIVNQRVAAEQQAIAQQKAQEAALVAKLEQQKQAVKDFEAVVAKFDEFTPEQGAAELGKLIQEARKAGEAAGVDPEILFNTLREMNQARIKIEREAAVQATEARLIELQKQLERQEALEKAALEKRKAAEIQAAKDIGEVVRQNLVQQELLKAEIAKLAIQKDIVGNNDPIQQKALFDAQDRFANALKLLEQQSENLNLAKNNGDLQAQQKIIAELARTYEYLKNQLAEIEKLKLATQGIFAQGQVNRNQQGNLLLPKQAGIPQQSVLQVITDLEKLTAATAKNQAIITQAAQAEKAAIESQRQLAAELGSVALAHEHIARAAGASGDSAIRAYEAANRVLDGTIGRLREINALLQAQVNPGAAPAAPQFAHGGAVYRASGGRGTDRMAAFLSKGEFVMDRLATRQYEPILANLNRQPPNYRANGGQTINFGDINIHAAAGTSEQQAGQIWSHIQRRIRRGV